MLLCALGSLALPLSAHATSTADTGGGGGDTGNGGSVGDTAVDPATEGEGATTSGGGEEGSGESGTSDDQSKGCSIQGGAGAPGMLVLAMLGLARLRRRER